MKHPLLICILVITFGCRNITHKSPEFSPYIIDIENNFNKNNDIPLSSLGNSLEYIPLETIPESIIEDINLIYIADSIIFIADSNKRLIIFDMNGRFIRQIGKNGRGPDEYLSIQDFAIDTKNEEIYILSNYRKILVYDFSGNFKRIFDLGISITQLILDKNGRLIIHLLNSPNQNSDTSYSWYITDQNGNIEAKIINTLRRNNGILTNIASPIYMYNYTPYFMEFGHDTLYKYEDSELIPHAVFNCGKHKLSPDPQTISDITQAIDKIWVYKVSEIKDLILITLWYGHHSILNCIYNKNEKSFNILNQNSFMNDIDSGMRFWPRMEISDGIMIDYIEAQDFIKFVTLEQSANSKIKPVFLEVFNMISETSNPIIVFLKK